MLCLLFSVDLCDDQNCVIVKVFCFMVHCDVVLWSLVCSDVFHCDCADLFCCVYIEKCFEANLIRKKMHCVIVTLFFHHLLLSLALRNTVNYNSTDPYCAILYM